MSPGEEEHGLGELRIVVFTKCYEDDQIGVISAGLIANGGNEKCVQDCNRNLAGYTLFWKPRCKWIVLKWVGCK